jgi:hypothetical protein
VVEQRRGADPVDWLRFLVREVLAPQAREKRERAIRLGLPGGHRVEGQVRLEGALGSRLLVVAGRQVRVRRLVGSEGGGGPGRSGHN